MTTASQYYKVTARVGVPHRAAVEVTIPLVGPQGPAGPAGTGLETLTTPGDTLYQGASTGERLPIGSAGQVLKVVNGLPAWGNESGAVTTYTVTGSSFTVPAVRSARVFIDPNPFGSPSNVTINLNSGVDVLAPLNLDRVEVILVRIQSGFKVTVAQPGFDSFDFYGTQKATFVYSALLSPPRWVKTFDNVFQDAAPTTVASVGQPGAIAFDGTHIYICIGDNDWRRTVVSTWSNP